MAIPAAFKGIGLKKAVLFAAGLIPLVAMLVTLATNPPVDPYERIAAITGENALRFLILALLVTPLKVLFKWKFIGAFRRTLGVLCFVYACAHFLAYQILEADFSISYFIEDLEERRYVLMGGLAFIMLVPLGLTSHNYAVRKLGGKVWKRVHLMVFPSLVFACIHLLWQVRGKDLTEPLVYMAITAILIGFRVAVKVRSWYKAKSRKSVT